MDDRRIVELYWQRSEQAVRETADKYGAYCMRISMNILNDHADSEENVNDTYLQTWRAIPPQRPESLTAFLGKIARNLALNRLKARQTQKRGGDAFTESLDELDDCTPAGLNAEDAVCAQELGQAISAYLRKQKPDARNVFLSRYFYAEPLDEIAKRFGFSLSKVKSMLLRTRNGLRTYLEKEGYSF